MILIPKEQLATNTHVIESDYTISDDIVQEFKTFARIDSASEDESIRALISACVQACEKYTGRALMEQTIDYCFNTFGKLIELPYPPLQSVVSFSVRDADGDLSVVDSAGYYVLKERIPGAVALKAGTSITISDSVVDPYVIRFVAGYSDDFTGIPESIKQSVFVWANDAYQNRVVQPEPPSEVKLMLSLYMVERI